MKRTRVEGVARAVCGASLVIVMTFAAACVSRPLRDRQDGSAGAPAGSAVGVPAELTDPQYLYEILRHVYRWQLDETDVDHLSGTKAFPFWVHMVDGPLDAGDRSRMAEITMPLVGAMVRVKKADYRIDELNLSVTSGVYRITNVSKVGIPDKPLPQDRVINIAYDELKAHLFRTRFESTYPDDVLRERLRVAVRTEMGLNPAERSAGPQIVHVAPLSPVANEAWVFWENQKLLIRFASDIDLVNPDVWKRETLMVRTWDIRNQVVVSLDEAAGSNAFMTRAQIGRALYNCVVLGQRLEMGSGGGGALLAGTGAAAGTVGTNTNGTATSVASGESQEAK